MPRVKFGAPHCDQHCCGLGSDAELLAEMWRKLGSQFIQRRIELLKFGCQGQPAFRQQAQGRPQCLQGRGFPELPKTRAGRNALLSLSFQASFTNFLRGADQYRP